MKKEFQSPRIDLFPGYARDILTISDENQNTVVELPKVELP